MIKLLKNRISDRFYLHFYVQPFARKQTGIKNFNQKNTIALFTHPRGGSTWLAEILKNIPDAALVDEPLWRGIFQSGGNLPGPTEGKLKETRALNFYYYQPIPEKAEWPEAEAFFYKLFNREIANLNIYRETNICQLNKADTFIYKFNFGHLLLPWLRNKFDFRAICMTRHPCAVVASQLKHPSWQKFLQQPIFHTPVFRYCEVFQVYDAVFRQLKHPEEILAAIWALNTKHTIYHPDNGVKWLSLSYEKLVLSPETELEKLFRHIELPIPENMLHSLAKPSVSTNPDSFYHLQATNRIQQLSRWKKDLNPQQIVNILKVLETFDIDLYSENIEPDYSKNCLLEPKKHMQNT